MAAKKEKGFLGEKGPTARESLEYEKKQREKGTAKPKKDPMMDMAKNITDRYRVTAREARDIVTAVSTAAKLARSTSGNAQDSRKNLKKQITETARAAVTGKKGSRSGQAVSSSDISSKNIYLTASQLNSLKTKNANKKAK